MFEGAATVISAIGGGKKISSIHCQEDELTPIRD